MDLRLVMILLCYFLFHPPLVLARSASSSQSETFGPDSVSRDLKDIDDTDRASLGLSEADIEELQEVSHAAVRDEDLRILEAGGIFSKLNY